MSKKGSGNPMTKTAAVRIQANAGSAEKGSFAARAQSAAQKNVNAGIFASTSKGGSLSSVKK